MIKKSSPSSDKIARELRTTLQGILRERVKNMEEREVLALAIKRSRSHVESMLYEGKGGLDSWVKAFAHCFRLNPSALKSFKFDQLMVNELDKADQIWYKLKHELHANETDRYYYARIAYAAHQIKQELNIKKKVANGKK